MTPRFILDENVVILARRGTDDHHNPNSICSDLVQSIIQICHTLVVDDVLWSYYEDSFIVKLTKMQTRDPKSCSLSGTLAPQTAK